MNKTNYKQKGTNVALISGVIVSDFNLSHSILDKNFFSMNISVKRLSGTTDIIPVIISETMINWEMMQKGSYVKIKGQWRSFNKYQICGKNKLILYVFAQEIEITEQRDQNVTNNEIQLDGYICKSPVYRLTPRGREIADVLIAVNRPYGKTDYIPCVCWGMNAKSVGNFHIGMHLKISGRIQSRSYTKKLKDGMYEDRTAYEISVGNVESI